MGSQEESKEKPLFFKKLPPGDFLRGHQKWPQVFPTIVLTVVLGIAVYVRLLGLGAESFWLDEGYSLACTELPFRKRIAYIATRDVHPPLYYILFTIWRSTGNSEMWLRIPSAVFGIAAVAYMKVNFICLNG